MVKFDLEGTEPLENATVTVPRDAELTKSTPTAVSSIEPEAPTIDIKLDQYMLDKEQFGFSLLFSGGLPKNVKYIKVDTSISLNDDPSLGPGRILSKVLDPEVPIVMNYHSFTLPEGISALEKIHFKIKINFIQIVSESEGVKNVYGPWFFEFDVESRALADETQIYQLSKPLQLDKFIYKVDSLLVNPIRQVLTVRLNYDEQNEGLISFMSLIPGNLKGFVLTTNDGSEIEFTFQSETNDEEGHILLYEPSENQFAKLKDATIWRIIPYVARKHWQAEYPGVKGYFPLEDAAILIDREIIE